MAEVFGGNEVPRTVNFRPMKFLLSVLIASAFCIAHAQSNQTFNVLLTAPLDYQVFQRQTEGGGDIMVEGMLEVAGHAALTNLERLEARLTSETISNDWQVLAFDNRVRQFRGEMTAPAGGWYHVELRLVGNGETFWETNVEHVGVGEIFLISGQSNSANHGEGKQQANNPLVVAFGNGIWQPARDPEPGASGKGGSFMPAFGDAMADRFKVPIGLVALGEGSTSVREWLPKNDAVAAPSDTGRNVITTGLGRWVCNGDLFERITHAEEQLGVNGFRAMFWHQGESDSHESADRAITPAQYRQYLQRVIEASRAAAGWRVPWFVAQASYHNPADQGSPELRAAQKSLVTDGIALAGPNTDTLGPEFRQNNGKGIHLNPRGLQRHGQMWMECVAPWLEMQLASPRNALPNRKVLLDTP